MTELLFKQRMFSWFDSYDIYDVNGETRFVVRGRPAWGHKLEIYDRNDRYLGKIQQEVLMFLPRFDLYVGAVCNGWQVQGDWLEWEYEVMDGDRRVMRASKELLHWTDTYAIQVVREEDVLLSLMIVLAIDAAKCSAGD